jgi:hypothetical protein
MQNENDEVSHARSEYADALAEVNKQVIDLLVESRGPSGNFNRVVNNATPAELEKFAKAIQEMADMLRYVKKAEQRSQAS